MSPARAGVASGIVLALATIGGCGHHVTEPGRAIPGSDAEIGWWATISSTTSITPTTSGTVTTTVSAPSDVLFDFGSAVLNANAGNILDGIARDLSDERVQSITVVGYTDQLGNHNDELGLTRARAVIAYLVGRGGAASKFEHPGTAGATKPLCPEVRPDGSDDADCRARDRRVTITYTTVDPGR